MLEQMHTSELTRKGNNDTRTGVSAGHEIKCEVADKLCMVSPVARRKGEHQCYLLWLVTNGILRTRFRNLG